MNDKSNKLDKESDKKCETYDALYGSAHSAEFKIEASDTQATEAGKKILKKFSSVLERLRQR